MILHWPLPAVYQRITSTHGPAGNDGKPHTGIDISCEIGTPVLAAHDGVVHYEHTQAGGNVIRLIGSECYTRYCHLLSYTADEGEGGATACALQLPAANAWTDANITFDGSFDDVTYGPVLADIYNTEYVVTMPATAALKSQIVPLDLDVFAGIRYLKIRSGTAATPVNQAAARSIRIAFRPV